MGRHEADRPGALADHSTPKLTRGTGDQEASMSNLALSESVEECAILGARGLLTEHRPYFVRSVRGIDRLATIDDRVSGRSEIDWDIINRAIQEKLSQLTERVTHSIPNLMWKSGSHSARCIALSSYRIYDQLDGDDFDPVYAGITIVEGDGVVRISGDISGEETGHIYFDQGCEFFVAPDFGSVLAAAAEVASRISAQEQIVIQAIRTPHSSVM
jgi:hypothetical protein